MAVKRRTIWMSDGDWDALTERATNRALSNSAYIRAATIGGGFVVPEDIHRIARELDARPNPYSAFRPAPKPGRK